MIYVNGSILDERPAGLGVYTKNVVQHLSKLDKDMVVFCPVAIEGVNTKNVTEKVKTKYKKKGGLVRFLWTQFVLPFRVKKAGILYHPFQYLCLFSRTKQIITLHDLIPVYYPEVAKHQYYYYKMAMPMLLKKAYKVVCISENTKKDIMKYYNIDENKIKVIYNGYDSSFFNEANKDVNVLKKYNIDYNYMIMVGASYRHKNLHTAIRAYAKVKDELDCKMVIVGKDSPYIKELKELTEKLGISEDIIFLGYVPDEDLPSLYGFSKCFVYPTLYEGFGLPILEAMGCGTAVICSNNSSLPEVAGDAALFFDPKDEQDIGEAMKKIVKDEALKQELYKRAKNNIKKFSWENTSKDIYKLMK